MKRALFALLAAAVIVFMSRTTPGYVEITAPFVIRGASGDWVNARTFGLRVEKSHLVRTIRQKRFRRIEERTTSGVWVIVRVDAVAIKHPTMLANLALLTRDGKRYRHSERVYLPAQIGLIGRDLQPEMPTPALLVFEVPEQAIQQLELAAAEGEFTTLDSEVRIPLTMPASIRESVDFS
jgi:hypothetical protein